MGSVLVDRQLYGDREAAEKQCERNVGPLLAKVSEAALISLCEDENPAILWGKYGMVHWLLNPKEWVTRLLTGNGIDRSWSRGEYQTGILSSTPCRARQKPPLSSDDLRALLTGGPDITAFFEALQAQQETFPELASLDVNLGLLTIPLATLLALFADPLTEDQVIVHPYRDFLNSLCEDGARRDDVSVRLASLECIQRHTPSRRDSPAMVALTQE
jgi:hypothetical protein